MFYMASVRLRSVSIYFSLFCLSFLLFTDIAVCHSFIRTAENPVKEFKGKVDVSYTVKIGNKSKSIRIPMKLHLKIIGDAKLEANEQETFWLASRGLLTDTTNLVMSTVYQYKVTNTVQVAGTHSGQDGALPQRTLGLGYNNVVVEPTVLVVLESQGRLARNAMNTCDNVTLIEATPKWVLSWEDLEGTISNTTTTYEYEVRRNDYIGTTRIASGSCSTNTGKVSVAIDPDPAPRERRVYEIYIKLTRKGPAFKDNTTYRRHFTVTATKGSVEGMSLLEQQSN